jgi:hypothetical protein
MTRRVYNFRMRYGVRDAGTRGRALFCLAATALLAANLSGNADAKEKKDPQGNVEDESVAITATILSPEEIKDTFGTDFDNNFIVLSVNVAPKGGKPYEVRLDDFILRSESNGEHSGPLIAGEIAGQGALVVQRLYGNRPNADSARPIEGTKVQVKEDDKANPALVALKQKILAEKTTGQPESGLLFFALSKEKPRNLILSCKTPQSKLRMSFK